MNKKFLLFGLPILAIGLVAAALTYYALATVTLNVNQPIDVDGVFEQIVNCDAGDTCLGEAITISNDGNSDREIVITALSVPNYATMSYNKLETLEDTRNQEKVWGGNPDLVDLKGQLEVSVSYENGYAVFKATPPSDYDAEKSLTTFTFDTDSNGLADFQVQYDGSNVWVYSEVDETNSIWFKDTDTGWLNVPSKFITDLEGREFTLKVPMSILGLDSNYKFGVQTNGESGHQTFYSTDARHLWYDEALKDYVHSTYYVSMDLGIGLSDPATITISSNSGIVIVPELEIDKYASDVTGK